jgi:type III secretion apparatus needle protein
MNEEQDMAFNIDNVNSTLGNAAAQFEGNVEQKVQSLQGKDVSNQEMLDLQFQLSKWQLATSLQSNVMKTLSEGIRGTIQNLR